MVIGASIPEVYQLWSKSQGIIHMVNLAMLPFLTIFGIEVDHGMSPFKRYFDSKEDIMAAV